MRTEALRMENISMEFSGVYVLSDMQLQVGQGSIHALVGENGAGKSTLIKILGGIYKPKTGKIFIDGEESSIHHVQDAQKKGISIIHQEISLVPSLNIAENVFLGRELSKLGFKSEGKMLHMAQEMIDALGIDLSARTAVSELTIAQQQLVEIIKAVSFNARILVLDEPTSSLTVQEVDKLFEMMRMLRDQGISLIYISHKMDEIFEICDEISVLRDGKMIMTKPTAETNMGELIAAMVGRSLESRFPPVDNSPGDTILSVQHLSTKYAPYLQDISFDVREGEIFGLYGLVGAGRTELARVLFGIDPSDCGEIIKDGRTIKLRSPADAIKNRIGMIPEDRKEYGLITRHDVQNNLTLVKLRELPWFLRTTRREEELTDEYIQKLSIATKSRYQLLERLSGGNQQKVVIAKWISMELDVIILDEPTRGVDVKAKAEIYELMRSLAESGKCIIMISSDLPEILRVSHRVVVMHDGAITLDSPTAELDQEKILYAALN